MFPEMHDRRLIYAARPAEVVDNENVVGSPSTLEAAAECNTHQGGDVVFPAGHNDPKWVSVDPGLRTCRAELSGEYSVQSPRLPVIGVISRLRRMRRKSLLLFAVLAVQSCLAAQTEYGTFSARTPNTTLQVPLELPRIGLGLTNLFADLTFDNSVCIKSPPGETNRLFVVERTGRIMVVTNLANPDKAVFLDLTADTFSILGEAGLLGLAFHPGYATNGYFYVFRTALTTTPGATNQLHDVLSRFEVSPDDPNVALPGSELRLIAQYDYNSEHNAGEVVFGPDGYLYVSLGDLSPPPRDRSSDPQAIDKGFFGGIIRIDVDQRPDSLPPNPHPGSTTNYAIPSDNPFIGCTNHNGLVIDPNEVRTEFYAIGLRNPWRMAFDTVTGILYCGDVGASSFEEINLIERGGNYGWPYQEGPLTYPSPPPDFSYVPPLYDYGHGYGPYQGRCVIGGVVYHGAQLPDLDGAYLFGDFISGNIWALRHEGTNVTSINRVTGERGIGAFGLDPRDGGILVANIFRKTIQKLIYVPPEQTTPLPPTLADTGVFSDLSTLTPNPGILPYEINVPFWSDNALKKRWFSLPDTNALIGFHPIDPWTFPEGTVWIKHFDLELTNGVVESARRLETRILVKNTNGIYGLTYRWDPSQTNATLVEEAGLDEDLLVQDGGIVRTQVWHYPSRMECLLCHTAAAGYALGFNTAQLHRNVEVEGQLTNQIDCLQQLGYFQTNSIDISNLRPLAAATNTDYPVGYRVKSFLASNCAQCHQPGVMWELDGREMWDARFPVPLSDSKIVNGPLLAGDFGDSSNRVMSPGAPDKSVMLARVGSRGWIQMPPLSTSYVSSNAVDLLTEWINSYPVAPWKLQDITPTEQEGFSSVNNGVIQVSGSGLGIGRTNDSFHFLYQSLPGKTQIVTRVAGWQTNLAEAQFGIMLRASTAADAPFAMLALNPTGDLVFLDRANAAASVARNPIRSGCEMNLWLKIVCETNHVSAYTSTNGADWSSVAEATVSFDSGVLAGLATASGHPTKLHTAEFQNVSLLGLNFSLATNIAFTAPASVPFNLLAGTGANSVAKIELYANGSKIGEITGPPYDFVWTNAWAGNYAITALISDAQGNSLASIPINLQIQLPTALARLEGTDSLVGGAWPGQYGQEGFLIPAYTNALPAYASLEPRGISEFVWEDDTPDERALLKPDSALGIASVWYADDAFTIELACNDGNHHQLTLYFVDWDGNDTRSQTIEIWDPVQNQLLDQQTVAAFSTGTFLRWLVRGRVSIRLVRQGAINAVLNGIFLDPSRNQLPFVNFITPTDGAVVTLPAEIALQADAADADGEVQKVEFFRDGTKLGEATAAPFTVLWTNLTPGTHVLTARATDDVGQQNSVDLSVQVAPAPAKAVFLGQDTATQGSWIGRYGADGYAVAVHATNYPGYVQVPPGDRLPFVWLNQTDAPQALERTDSGRIASTWYNEEALDFSFNFLDGNDHRVSLYFLDWDHNGPGNGTRVAQIEVRSAADNTLLDSRSIAGFANGLYYTWQMAGQIKLRIIRVIGNDVVSGLFFDPLTPSFVPLTISADDQSKVYGEGNPAFTASYSGFIDGDDSNALIGTLAFSTTATASSDTGTYPIQVSGIRSTKYAISFVDGTFTVNKTPLTATANNQSRAYGQTNPALTVSYSGFVNGDNAAMIDVPAAASTAAETNSPSGSYEITLSGGSDNNYALSLVDGTLTVNKAELIAKADNQSRAYGQTNPVLTVSYSGFVNGDNAAMIDVPPVASTLAETNSPIGSYEITLSGGTDENYSLALSNGTLTVNKAELIARADDQSRAYGQTNPVLTVSYSGFVNGDNAAVIDVPAAASTPAETNSPSGSYEITLSGGSDNNYALSLVDGTLTVNKAELIAKADNQSRVYGTTNPVLTVSYSGFVNGDNAAMIDVPPAASTPAETNSPSGSYEITLSVGSDENYSLALSNGTLTVTAVPPTISIDLLSPEAQEGPMTAQLTAQGEPNLRYTIESSTNFVDWNPLSTQFTSPSGTITVTATNLPTSPTFFYRVVLTH